MKKFAAAVLIISLFLTLAGCAEKRVYKKVGITPSDISETESVTEEEATTEPETETETETESETESTPTTTRRRGGSISQPSTRPHTPVVGNNPSTTRGQTPEVPTADIRPTVPPAEDVPATVPSTNAPEATEPTQTEPEVPTDGFFGD